MDVHLPDEIEDAFDVVARGLDPEGPCTCGEDPEGYCQPCGQSMAAQNKLDRIKKHIAALVANNAALLGVLLSVEHAESRNPDEGMRYCPACGECEGGHATDCHLGRVLHGEHPGEVIMADNAALLAALMSNAPNSLALAQPHPGAMLLEELERLRALERSDTRLRRAKEIEAELGLSEAGTAVGSLLDRVKRLEDAATKAVTELRNTYGHIAHGQPTKVARAISLLETASTKEEP